MATVLLLTLAAMQPVVRTSAALRARTDAQAFVVLDTSRSMLAAPAPDRATRLAKAKQLALALATGIGSVPIGVATFTDRVLPDLFPTTDRAVFDSTVSAVTIESPPPRDVAPVATTFDALSALATQGFFPASVRKRAAVVFTDGESAAFDPSGVASALAAHGVRVLIVRVGSGVGRVWSPGGRPEAGYVPDPAGARADIARMNGALGASGATEPARFVRRVLGRGTTRHVGTVRRTRTLAPIPAALALVPLLLLLIPRGFVKRYVAAAGAATRRTVA